MRVNYQHNESDYYKFLKTYYFNWHKEVKCIKFKKDFLINLKKEKRNSY